MKFYNSVLIPITILIFAFAFIPAVAAHSAEGIKLDENIEVSIHDMPQGIIDTIDAYYREMDTTLDEVDEYRELFGWIVDLDEDRQKEYIIFDPYMSGANSNGVATQLVLWKNDTKWSIISTISGPWLYKVGPGRTNGYLDLYGGNTVSGANYYETKLIWNGREYIAAPPEYDYYTVTIKEGTLNLRDSPSTSAEVVYSLDKGQCVAANENTQSADGFEWININLPKSGWVAAKFLTKSKTCAEAFAISNAILEIFRGQYELAAEDACSGGGGYELFLPEAYYTWFKDRVPGRVPSETFRTDPNTMKETKEHAGFLEADGAGYVFQITLECGDDVDTTFHKSVVTNVEKPDSDRFDLILYTGADCVPKWQFSKIKGKWLLQKETNYCIY